MDEKRPRRSIDVDGHRHAAGLVFDVGGHGEQRVRLPVPGRGLHVLGAAEVDPLLQIDRLAGRRVIPGITGADALHSFLGAAVAARAGLAGRPLGLRPSLRPILDPKERGVDIIVVLNGAGLRFSVLVAGGRAGYGGTFRGRQRRIVERKRRRRRRRRRQPRD